jgi:hypothetical protein
MEIHGLVVSVDYSSELARSIDRWITGLASLAVVTAPRDEETIALVRKVGADLHLTEAFWEEHAHFNKARAMEEARARLSSEGWHLFIDADVIPPVDWLAQLEAAAPTPGTLHGARRVFEDGRPLPDHELAGFFQLFHSSDPRATRPLDRDWLHGGNYDSTFMGRWPAELQRILDLTLVHLGEPGQNWCGRGNDEAMRKIRERRRSRPWQSETVHGKQYQRQR